MSFTFLEFVNNKKVTGVIKIKDNSGEILTENLTVTGEANVNSDINIGGKLKISNGEIEFRDNTLKFHNGDDNWKSINGT